MYDTLTLWVKDNDKKYIVYSVEGYIYFRNNINDCYKKQKEIIKELNDFFKDDGIKDNGLRTRKHSGDKSGKSTAHQIFFSFKDAASFFLVTLYSDFFSTRQILLSKICKNAFSRFS